MGQFQKTLVILSPGFSGSEEDTTCLPAQQALIRALNKNFPELNITILSFQYPYISASYQWYNNRVISFNGKNRGKIFRLMVWLRVWRALKKLHKENNIVGLFSFWCTECALIGNRFGKYYGIKHRIWILGQDAKKGNKYVKRIQPVSTELVALSDFIKLEFQKNHGIIPQHTIPLGIEPELFLRETFAREIDILGVGSLIPLKQFDWFVEIIKEIKSRIPGVKAKLCGNGSEFNKLRTLINDFDLQSSLTLLGEIPHNEVLKTMRQTKILLHTSNYEGFGAVCIEALYAGAHVISFVKPINVEIKNWHIVHTKEEMIKKALHILQNKETVYEPVLVYSMDDNAKKVMELFE